MIDSGLYQTVIFIKDLKYMEEDLHLQNIVSFMKNYSINHIDEHTLVIEPISPHDLANSIHTNDTNPYQSSPYLVKFMNLPKNTCHLPQIIDTLSQHQNLKRKYLLTLLTYEIIEHPNTTIIQAIYQYSNRSLKQQIANRIQNNAIFDQQELWAILSTIVKGLSHLEEKNIVYGVLGTDKIFINETVKLLDPSATATDPLQIAQGRLYSPQILNNSSHIDMFRSDVYVAGLVLLESALLIDLTTETQPNLQQYLELFKSTYSEQLYLLIEQMITIDPHQRITLSDIRQYLSSGLNQTNVRNIENTRLIPLEHDEQAVPSHNEDIEQLQQYESYDILCERDDEKQISQYEKARLSFIPKNIQKSPSSTTRSSHIYRYGNNQQNQCNRHNTMRKKKTKQIKNKLIKTLSQDSLEQESYESSERENNLFTDPELMKIIQSDLERISTTRNSAMRFSKQNRWFHK